jgi:hypothetical protein
MKDRLSYAGIRTFLPASCAAARYLVLDMGCTNWHIWTRRRNNARREVTSCGLVLRETVVGSDQGVRLAGRHWSNVLRTPVSPNIILATIEQVRLAIRAETEEH